MSDVYIVVEQKNTYQVVDQQLDQIVVEQVKETNVVAVASAGPPGADGADGAGAVNPLTFIGTMGVS